MQDIIDKIPNGFSPKDVKIKFGASYHQMGPTLSDHVFLDFVYRKPIDLEAEIKRYKKEEEKYKVAMAEYDRDVAKYKKWLKEKKLSELREEIAKLEEDEDE